MSSKIKKFPSPAIKKITGGRDPIKVIESFISSRGHDPEECLEQRNNNFIQWLMNVENGTDLEITLEGLNRIEETTLYLGINILPIPLKDTQRFYVNALLAADTLIESKLSIVNYDLVLSSTIYGGKASVENIDYAFEP